MNGPTPLRFVLIFCFIFQQNCFCRSTVLRKECGLIITVVMARREIHLQHQSPRRKKCVSNQDMNTNSCLITMIRFVCCGKETRNQIQIVLNMVCIFPFEYFNYAYFTSCSLLFPGSFG